MQTTFYLSGTDGTASSRGVGRDAVTFRTKSHVGFAKGLNEKHETATTTRAGNNNNNSNNSRQSEEELASHEKRPSLALRLGRDYIIIIPPAGHSVGWIFIYFFNCAACSSRSSPLMSAFRTDQRLRAQEGERERERETLYYNDNYHYCFHPLGSRPLKTLVRRRFAARADR